MFQDVDHLADQRAKVIVERDPDRLTPYFPTRRQIDLIVFKPDQPFAARSRRAPSPPTPYRGWAASSATPASIRTTT
jgi:hypothetical protein